ncbi:unnamed protein product, partial [Iphiclides podalirius]
MQVMERGVSGDRLPILQVADRSEHKEVAVGLMCLNTQINYEALEESFELSPFAGLKHLDDHSNIKRTKDAESTIREVGVRHTEEYDIPYMIDVLEHAPRKNELVELIESSLISQTLESYVLLSRNQPVGVVVITPIEDPTSVRILYDLELEPSNPGTDGNVLVGVLSPALEPHSRWYMREVLRKSRFTQMFWRCRTFAKGEASPGRNLMSLASHMVPVAPYPHVPCSGAKDNDKHKESSPYALWTVNRAMTSLPKIYINRSIVVVGASRTGLAFLETLLMGPTCSYLTFTNLTLMSVHGLPTVSECLHAADTCVPHDGRYTDRYLKSVPYYFYVDVITGVMVRIDRLPMDDPRYQPDRVPPPPHLPENVMLINSLFDANTCLRKLLWMISDSKDFADCLHENNRIVVYGECLDAYSCIAALLELGIEPSMLAFVEPFPPEDPAAMRVNCFNNETVDERVQSGLEELGIQVYRRCYFHGWKTFGSRVETLHFMTQNQAISFPCFAFFYYGIKAIDLQTFKGLGRSLAITECGLVYDGGLVVGTGFETNDPYVYGAGTCTGYSRRYYAHKHAQRFYCSEDVGEVVYDLLRSRFSLYGDHEIPQFQGTCADIPSCGFGPEEALDLGTFRSVIDKFVARTSLAAVEKAADIPSECGQSAAVRDEALGFWKAVGGERIVVAHLARYLQQTHASNPQYSLPKPEYY